MATKHSNWRDDLREVVDSGSEDQNDNEIREKKVKNKIDINPSIREAVAELGGQLIDMREESEVTPEYVKKKKDILRNIMDTIRQNRNRCRALGSKSGAFVNEGNCKCSGCAPDGVGHQNPCVECGGHHKDKLDEGEMVVSEGETAAQKKRRLEAARRDAKKRIRAIGPLKDADRDGDGWIRVIDAEYEPEGEVIDETLTSLKAASFGMPHKEGRTY